MQSGKRKKIVDEANGAPNAVLLTARKYGVQGNQIRKRQNTISLVDLLAYPTPWTGEEQGVIKAAKNNLIIHKGPPLMLSDDVSNHIIQF